MNIFLIFGFSILIKGGLSEILSPPEPFAVESHSLPVTRVKSEGTKTNKNDGGQLIKVKPTTPIVTGGSSKTVVEQDQPTVRSVKADKSDASTDSKKDKSDSSEGKTDDGNLDVPDNILQAVQQDEMSNLRGGNAEIKENSSSNSEQWDSKTDSGDKPKKDPLLTSIEGAEKQLSEAFGAVRSKIMTLGKAPKPIKVDCGTTRVRVVCSKKGEPETEESGEKSETQETKEEEKRIPEPELEGEEGTPEEATEGENSAELQEADEAAEEEE